MYPVKTPFFVKKIYPSLVWNLNRTEKSIYITFDDGPIPEVTPFVLAVLSEYNAKATFFCIGDNVQKHPEIFKQIQMQGHVVANHTFNHLNGWYTKTNEYVTNIEKCNSLVNTRLFRPPYGKIRPSQIIALKKNYKIIMWDVLSGDFDPKLSPDGCLQNVLDNTQNGSIIVFHDSLKAELRLKYTLPLALQRWSEQGFAFKTL